SDQQETSPGGLEHKLLSSDARSLIFCLEEDGMSDIVQLEMDQYRLLVALRYLNASEAICNGLQRQRGVNDFHFLVTLRSFIEYTRRGIWFLAWASEEKLRAAGTLTFDRAGSPGLAAM